MFVSELEIPLDRDVVIRLSEEYLKRLARRLRWKFEEVVESLGCEKVEGEEGVYECYAVVIKDGKVHINPYTLAVALKLRDQMYRLA